MVMRTEKASQTGFEFIQNYFMIWLIPALSSGSVMPAEVIDVWSITFRNFSRMFTSADKELVVLLQKSLVQKPDLDIEK